MRQRKLIDRLLWFLATASMPIGIGIAATEPAGAASSRTSTPFNLVLISIDTLRADHLGSYGYPRPTSPNLDAVARRGIRFAQAYSAAPWTTPAHVSLFSGQHPSTHGVNQSWSHFKAAQAGHATYRTLPLTTPVLPEILHDAGYRTVAVTGGGTMASELGFGRGFEHYVEGQRRVGPAVFRELVEAFTPTQPFFVFFHTFEVHAAYTRPHFARDWMTPVQLRHFVHRFSTREAAPLIHDVRDFLQQQGLFRREITKALYDGGIRHVDSFLGRLFDWLKAHKLWEQTAVLITSDHGEEFGERDPRRIYDSHCTTLYNELLRIPVILHHPKRPGPRVVTHPVHLVDLAPTLLQLLGLDIPATMQGVSRVPSLSGRPGKGPPLTSEATCTGAEWKALVDGGYKYIAGFDVGSKERAGVPGPIMWERLYHLDHDPQERVDLSRTKPDLTGQMRSQLLQRFQTLDRRRKPSATPVTVSPETVEMLRSLGYVE